MGQLFSSVKTKGFVKGYTQSQDDLKKNNGYSILFSSSGPYDLSSAYIIFGPHNNIVETFYGYNEKENSIKALNIYKKFMRVNALPHKR